MTVARGTAFFTWRSADTSVTRERGAFADVGDLAAEADASCAGADVCSEDQVAICHVPPGNPDDRHAICVGAPAVDTHVERHGDYVLDDDNKDKCARDEDGSGDDGAESFSSLGPKGRPSPRFTTALRAARQTRRPLPSSLSERSADVRGQLFGQPDVGAALRGRGKKPHNKLI